MSRPDTPPLPGTADYALELRQEADWLATISADLAAVLRIKSLHTVAKAKITNALGKVDSRVKYLRLTAGLNTPLAHPDDQKGGAA